MPVARCGNSLTPIEDSSVCLSLAAVTRDRHTELSSIGVSELPQRANANRGQLCMLTAPSCPYIVNPLYFVFILILMNYLGNVQF